MIFSSEFQYLQYCMHVSYQESESRLSSVNDLGIDDRMTAIQRNRARLTSSSFEIGEFFMTLLTNLPFYDISSMMLIHQYTDTHISIKKYRTYEYLHFAYHTYPVGHILWIILERNLENSVSFWSFLKHSVGLWDTLNYSQGVWDTLEHSGTSWSTLENSEAILVHTYLNLRGLSSRNCWQAEAKAFETFIDVD